MLVTEIKTLLDLKHYLNNVSDDALECPMIIEQKENYVHGHVNKNSIELFIHNSDLLNEDELTTNQLTKEDFNTVSYLFDIVKINSKN